MTLSWPFLTREPIIKRLAMRPFEIGLSQCLVEIVVNLIA
ncbi:protein of unknown function [Vibrio tapetis subsp. tapetis]|uniref:Uncharacterized protein n=1 Tax=Vibrio tapetis subsp. tapetis TaxID=1671868 RepID=A0A2N8ZMI4_9VIBR|nr:protein of unknown function [Vibrio tapetis subsp. tapetis]